MTATLEPHHINAHGVTVRVGRTPSNRIDRLVAERVLRTNESIEVARRRIEADIIEIGLEELERRAP